MKRLLIIEYEAVNMRNRHEGTTRIIKGCDTSK